MPGRNAGRPRIFVQIASYRDPECRWTIRDLLDKARHPERVSVGVCWQYQTEQDRRRLEVEAYPTRVRIQAVHARDSRGLCWARRQTQRLWEGEEYTLQIDSHMRFVPEWDERLIAMIARCPSAKPVLTTYPPGYTPPNQLSEPVLTRIHAGSFRADGTLSLEPRLLAPEAVAGGPIPTAFCAGGFMFAPGGIIAEVPYDPDIYFSGEEVLFSARAWTAGWDFYAPDEVTVFHYYGAREGSGRHWSDHERWFEAHERSNLRLRWILRMDEETDPAALGGVETHGLGRARSLEEYEAFSGVDFRRRHALRIPRSYGIGLPAAPVALADASRLLILGDGGIVVSESRGEVHHLNPLATFGWCAFEECDDPGALVRRLGETFGLPAETAESYVVNLLDEWARLGLLSSSSEPAVPITPSEPRVLEPGAPDRRTRPSRLRIPASALGGDRRCVLIPTTGARWVNLALLGEGLRAGHTCVAADLVYLLEEASPRVVGVEEPVSLDEASASFLREAYPDCFEPAAASDAGAPAVPGRDPPSPPSSPRSVSRVVFPSYHPGARTRLRRLAPEEALTRLLGLTTTGGGTVDFQTVASLTDLLRACRAYELSFSAFDAAALCAFDALDAPAGAAGKVRRRIAIATPADVALSEA